MTSQEARAALAAELTRRSLAVRGDVVDVVADAVTHGMPLDRAVDHACRLDVGLRSAAPAPAPRPAAPSGPLAALAGMDGAAFRALPVEERRRITAAIAAGPARNPWAGGGSAPPPTPSPSPPRGGPMPAADSGVMRRVLEELSAAGIAGATTREERLQRVRTLDPDNNPYASAVERKRGGR